MTNFNRGESREMAKPDIFEMVMKYLKLLWRKKFWIILITAFTAVVWILIYSFYLQTAAIYTTYAVIQFDDPRARGFSPITDFDYMSSLSKVAIVKGNSFLSRVVDSLKLNVSIVTPGIRRVQFFSSIYLDSLPKFGLYKFVKNNNKFRTYYTKKSEDISDRLIFSTNFHEDSTIAFDLNGLHLKINPFYFQQVPEIRVRFIPNRIASELLKNRIDTRLERTQTLLTIGYSDRDPGFSADVSNAIAKIFINMLYEQKRYQTSSVIASLEGQLHVSRGELEQAENNLRRFREQNPFVFLAQDGQSIVNEMSDYETSLLDINQNLSDLRALLEETQQSTNFEVKANIYRELLDFLDAKEVPGASPFAQQYDQIMGRVQTLNRENYSPDHPIIVDLKNQIQELKVQVDNLANSYLVNLESNLVRAEQNMDNFRTNLRRLPRKEIRLAELERDQQIKENILTSITTRYNEARITDAAIIPDAFIIDKAQPPLVFGANPLDKIKIYGIGLFLGFALGCGLFITLDFANKTVRSASDIENNLKLPLLATIPVIISNDELPEDFDLKKSFDEKLIVSDYAPNIAGESFRLLRTKLMIREEDDRKSYVIASLNPNEGKSLIAANLAITFAQQKIPTIIIDCDLRRGVLHNTFNCIKKPGITDILIGTNPLEFEDISNVIQNTHIPNLFILTAGVQIPNPSELLGSNRMLSLYGKLKDNFGVIIFDTPPINIIPEAIVLNNFVHSLILVVRYAKTSSLDLANKLSEFSNIEQDLLGVVINASEEFSEKKYQKYSYYNY